MLIKGTSQRRYFSNLASKPVNLLMNRRCMSTVILVSVDRTWRQHLAQALSVYTTTRETQSPQQALRLLRDSQVQSNNLVIFDQETSPEPARLQRFIERWSVYGRVIVIIDSKNTNSWRTVVNAMHSGATTCLTKSEPIDEICHKIHKHLDRGFKL